MRRRHVIAGLAALLLAPQRSSAEQSPGEIPRVGILTVADNDKSPMLDALREGLHDLGYIEGRNIILEFRFARGDPSRVPQLAAELVALPVDLIVMDWGRPLCRRNEYTGSNRRPDFSRPCGSGIRRRPRAAGREYYWLHPDAHRAERQACGPAAHRLSANHDGHDSS